MGRCCLKEVLIALFASTIFAPPARAVPARPLPAPEMELHTNYLFTVPNHAPLILQKREFDFLSSALAGAPEDVGNNVQLRTQYVVNVQGRQAICEITKTEFQLLETLKDQFEPLSDTGIAARILEEGAPASDVKEIVRTLNEKTAREIARIVVLESDDGYFLDRDLQDFEGVELDFPRAGTRLVYQGHIVPLSQKQLLFLRTVYKSENSFVTYEGFRDVMGWSSQFLSGRALDYTREINQRSILATGSPLLKKVPGQGVALDLSASPAIEPPARVETPYGVLDLSDPARRLLAKLASASKDTRLDLTLADLAEMRLSERQVLAGLSEINAQAAKLSKKPVVERLEIHLAKFGRGYYFRAGSFFQAFKNRFDCDRQLVL